jgi:thiol-disulfide isomerase/thioredoxin
MINILCADVDGFRFVEHFSPYCHHCRQFQPTWDDLVNHYAGSPVNLAQVNCAVYGGTSNSVSQRLCSLFLYYLQTYAVKMVSMVIHK